jgi:iron complex transport system ATP-binding protein
VIDIVDVSIDIAGRRIVDTASVTVPDSTFVGLLGPNGCGKSTLLKALYRMRRPSAGRIDLDGVDLLAMPARDAARRIAVVAQDGELEFDATVTEVVMIGRSPHKRGLARDDDTDREVIATALDRVGCAHLADRSIHTLSGGERQRVFIARALAQGCDHLVLDEPTNHLDVRYQVEVLEIVAGLGVSVLAALHDLSLAGLFCDTVHLMTRGRVVVAGTPAEVITPEAVHDAYGADVLVVPHPEHGTPHLVPRRTRPPHTSSPPTSSPTRRDHE